MKNREAAILLVDDHALILQGLQSVISEMPEIGEVCIASSGNEALSILEKKTFDLYLLDLELPEMDGLTLLKQIRRKYPAARIIVNTMHEEPWVIRKIMQLDLNGVVLKSGEVSELIDAVRAVLQGGVYFCREFKGLELQSVRRKRDVPECSMWLTQREKEVLREIAAGMQTREIAERLHVSVNTVESHRKSLMLKLEARNAVELVVKAIRMGLVQVEM